MSNTIKTTPWKYRGAADIAHLSRAVHDHHLDDPTGCDLPDSPATDEVTRCMWVPSPSALHGPDHIIDIDVFTTPVERASISRRVRHESHRTAHEIERASLVGITPDDLDDIL
jgi:hypothetical protein